MHAQYAFLHRFCLLTFILATFWHIFCQDYLCQWFGYIYAFHFTSYILRAITLVLVSYMIMFSAPKRGTIIELPNYVEPTIFTFHHLAWFQCLLHQRQSRKWTSKHRWHYKWILKRTHVNAQIKIHGIINGVAKPWLQLYYGWHPYGDTKRVHQGY